MSADTLELIAILVSVIGLFKGIEWVIQKITDTHDKSKKIDTNADNFAEFKEATDKKIAELQQALTKTNTSVNDAHKFAQRSIDNMKKEIVDTINDHRNEYISGINEVKQSIVEMSSVYQQSTALLELRIQTLSDRVEKHNSVIDRTYALEKSVGILENREKVSEHRLDDLESKK